MSKIEIWKELAHYLDKFQQDLEKIQAEISQSIFSESKDCLSHDICQQYINRIDEYLVLIRFLQKCRPDLTKQHKQAEKCWKQLIEYDVRRSGHKYSGVLE